MQYWFGERGWEYKGGGDRYVHYAKKGAILNSFVPHCSLSLLELETFFE